MESQKTINFIISNNKDLPKKRSTKRRITKKLR